VTSCRPTGPSLLCRFTVITVSTFLDYDLNQGRLCIGCEDGVAFIYDSDFFEPYFEFGQDSGIDPS
jgi:hypothetical protein